MVTESDYNQISDQNRVTVSLFIFKISFLIWSIFLAFIQAYDVYTYHMSIFFNLNVESKSSIILNNHKIVLQNVLRKGLTEDLFHSNSVWLYPFFYTLPCPTYHSMMGAERSLVTVLLSLTWANGFVLKKKIKIKMVMESSKHINNILHIFKGIEPHL